MANYYNMQEVMNKLRKTEQEVQELIKQGRLRQYLDAGKPVFHVDDVNTLAEEIVGLDITSAGLNLEEGSDEEIKLEETSEIQLEPDEEPAKGKGAADLDLDFAEEKPKAKESEGGFGLSQMGDLSSGDTNVGTVGINILSGTEDAYKLTEDTKAETQAAEAAEEAESLDADANLESFGSGSGLLDLSLQADDTSLGAVLDDILPAGAEGGAEVPAAAAEPPIGLAEEPAELGAAAEEPAEAAVPMAAVSEPAAPAAAVGAPVPLITVAPVDPRTNMYGIAMFLPALALLLAAVILGAAVQDVMPSLTKMLAKTVIADISLIWIVSIGLILLVIILSLASALGGQGGSKKEKAPKPKKEKPAKKRK